MHAKCGSIVRHHWAHVTNKDCDSWAESISPWHAAWQDCFPPECQEVWLGENNEHRADVKGEVAILEVQKSPLSPEKIREREEFYGNMAWMLCGEDFESNFELDETLSPETLEFSFRWKRMRTSWLAATRPIFIHFSKGIALVQHLDDDGYGEIVFIEARIMGNLFDRRFNPSPLHEVRQGFEPLKKGFIEQCNESFRQLEVQIDEARAHEKSCYEKIGGQPESAVARLKDNCELLMGRFTGAKRDSISSLLDASRKLKRHIYRKRGHGISYPANFSPAMFFNCYDDVESIRSRQGQIAESVKAWRLYLCEVEKVGRLHAVTARLLGGSVAELAQDYRRFLDCREFAFQFKLYQTLSSSSVNLLGRQLNDARIRASKEFVFEFRFAEVFSAAFIDFFESLLFDQFVAFLLHWLHDKHHWDNMFPFSPLHSIKSLFALMSEEFQAQVKLEVKVRWEKKMLEDELRRKREEKILKRRVEEDKQRWALMQRTTTHQALRERLSWPLEKVANCFADAVNGEVIGEYSLAEALAMNPGASWADQVDDEELLAARAQLKNFDPVSIYRS